MTAGRVGRTHTLDGSFRVKDPKHPLERGTQLTVGEARHVVAVRRGSADSPIVRLEGVRSREAAAALAGELLLVAVDDAPLEEDEWLAADLIGCTVEGVGTVVTIIDGPSCDVLELDQGTLIPLVTDAVLDVDVEARTVTVDRDFLGLDPAS